MNRKNLIVWIIILVIAAFGITSAKAQGNAANTFKTWRITTMEFIYGDNAPNGNSFRLDSNGNLEKRGKDYEMREILHKTYVQKIDKLLRELALPGTKTELVKGKEIYNYPYSHFTIELDGEGYLMEGVSFYDTEYLVLSAKQKEIFGELKGFLSETGCNPLKTDCKPIVKKSL